MAEVVPRVSVLAVVLPHCFPLAVMKGRSIDCLQEACVETVVFGAKIRQGASKIFQQTLVLVRNCNAGRTVVPNSHEPHGIKTKYSDGIPLGGRHRELVNCPA